MLCGWYGKGLGLDPNSGPGRNASSGRRLAFSQAGRLGMARVACLATLVTAVSANAGPTLVAQHMDPFVSGSDLGTTGTAQVRNQQTPQESQVMETLPTGRSPSGRWVYGADTSSRWLEIADGGDGGEGHLAGPGVLTAEGMAGFRIGATFTSIQSRLSPKGRYSSQDRDWDTAACEIYSTADGRADAMIEDGKLTRLAVYDRRLMTPEGIHVGSSESALAAAYGKALRKVPNPYNESGVDYLLWTAPDRGFLFGVYRGKVVEIRVGGQAIQYVEGCL